MKSDRLTRFLLERNREQSQRFASPDATLTRRKYRVEHPTEIAALKCMDGRLNLAVMTETPPGIIQPFRNIGGKFDLGWPYFGALMREWVEYSVSRARDAIVLVTYHYSKGDTHRGCKGFDYDTDAAKQAAVRLKEQFESVFGREHAVVLPIRVGIETDEDALIIHGENGEALHLGEEVSLSEDDLRLRIENMFPDARPRMIADLLPLLAGNQRHVAKLQEQRRPPEDIEHKEWVLGIGRGFDWLHLPNTALLIGPYSYNLADPIEKAAGILLDNLEHDRIAREDGVVVIASGVYRDPGIERLLAIEKARSLAELTCSTIATKVPALWESVNVLVGTVDLNTRLFTPVPFDPPALDESARWL